MTRIKICGLKREEDIRCINGVKPDYAGFIFAEKSHRYVDRQTAARLRGLLAPQIPAVGVFVDAPPEGAAELLRAGIIQIVQLHGHEDEAYIAALRKLTGAPVIQAFRIDTEEDVRRAERSTADFILLDHGAGGTGEAFDWKLIANLNRPFFLAGGLNPANAAEALAAAHPFAVDVSSGVETEKVKDPEKIRAFVNAVRDFDRIYGGQKDE